MSDFFEKLSGSEKVDKKGKKVDKANKSEKKINFLDGNEEEASPEDGQLAVDVFQTDGEIIIQSTIAGVKGKDIDISIQNDMVSIKGERKKEIEVEAENYFYKECYWGSFSRSIILPEEITAEKAKAQLKDGILTLRLPKAEKSQKTKIKVVSE